MHVVTQISSKTIILFFLVTKEALVVGMIGFLDWRLWGDHCCYALNTMEANVVSVGIVYMSDSTGVSSRYFDN